MVSVVMGSVGVVWDVVAGFDWVGGGAWWGGEGCGGGLGWGLGEGSCWTGHCCGVVGRGGRGRVRMFIYRLEGLAPTFHNMQALSPNARSYGLR